MATRNRLSDAMWYDNQSRKVDWELEQAYNQVLVPGTLFYLTSNVRIVDTADSACYGPLTITDTWAENPGLFAHKGAVALYMGRAEAIRKTINSTTGLLSEVTASYHTFIVNGRHVIPKNIKLVSPVPPAR